jgi:hypothetical protein
MIRVKINTYELFVRIQTSKFGSTATTKVWIEAENHFNAKKIKQRLYMGVIILFLILYWLKDKTREEKELFYKRLFRK